MDKKTNEEFSKIEESKPKTSFSHNTNEQIDLFYKANGLKVPSFPKSDNIDKSHINEIRRKFIVSNETGATFRNNSRRKTRKIKKDDIFEMEKPLKKFIKKRSTYQKNGRRKQHSVKVRNEI